MPETLTRPEVLRCYFEDGFTPRLPAMCLRWDEGEPARVWELPEGVRLAGPPPERFGFRVRRRGDDSYSARLLWNRTCFVWKHLPRAEFLAGSLGDLLGALGTDLWHLLDQPVGSHADGPERAA